MISIYELFDYLLSYDIDFFPKFEYKDDENGFWKLIKSTDNSNTINSIPDHRIWVKYY